MESLLIKDIRSIRKSLKLLRKKDDADNNEEAIHTKEIELTDVLAKYRDVTGHVFTYTLEEQAKEFCEDYYEEIDNNARSASSLSPFYDKHCVSFIVGYGSIHGRESIVSIILAKYSGIVVSHEIVNIMVDKVPPKNCVMAINCTCKIKLNNDTPRKVLQVFDVIKAPAEDHANSSALLIQREVFLVQDPRPLYHYPELKQLPVTKHDNWEPQFKPVVTQEELDRQAAAEEAQILQQQSVQKEEQAGDGSDSEDDSLEDSQYEEGDDQSSLAIEAAEAPTGADKGDLGSDDAEGEVADAIPDSDEIPQQSEEVDVLGGVEQQQEETGEVSAEYGAEDANEGAVEASQEDPATQ